MPNIADPTFIATMIALSIALALYLVLVPRRGDYFDPNISSEANKSQVMRGAVMLSSGIYAALPEGTERRRGPSPRIASLLRRAGNPWGVSVEEFTTLRLGFAFAGFVVGNVLWFLLTYAVHIPWFVVVLACTALGYFYPNLAYIDQAKQRDLDFKRQMPDALRLMNLSLRGGTTFTQAIRDSLPNMEDGAVKTEFEHVISNLDAGQPLSEALSDLADRSPNEGVRTFVQAIRDSTALNVPLVETIENQAEQSREEYVALVRARTAQVNSKMAIAMVFPLLICILIIAVAPAASMVQGVF